MAFQSWVLTCLRLLLGAVFLFSALGKARGPRHFAATVASYRLLPLAWTQPVAFLLIGAEAVVGVLLLMGWYTRAAASACALLLVVFTLAVGTNLVRGRKELECGCFGARVAHRIGVRHLLGQSLLLLAALCVALWGGGPIPFGDAGLGRQSLRALQDALPVVLALAGLWMLVRLTRQLRRLLLL